MTTIFENDLIKVITTGRDHGFIAIIDNKTDGQICIHYDEPGYNDNYDPILIAPNDWVGLLEDEEGEMVDSVGGFYDPTFGDIENYFGFEIAEIEQVD